uniref:Major sperm protein n=1 Tax=Caenorhabditis tropicalis TaxID=1561998 RepID=A0A1I7TMB4_9PELO
MPLPNKAGEPEFKLKTSPPDKLNFKYSLDTEAEARLVITNITKEHVCYKVKCTDNDIFRVRAPLGFIKPGEDATVKILLKPKPGIDPTRHYIAIYHVAVPEKKATDPRAVWTADTKAEGVLRMHVQLELDEKKVEEKEEKKDEKKEEKKEKKDEEKHDDK